MSESDGKDWVMQEPGVTERAREEDREGWIKAALPTVMGEYERGQTMTMVDTVEVGMKRAWSAGYATALLAAKDLGPCPSARPDSHERCWYRKGHIGRHRAPGVEWTDEQSEAHDLRRLEVSKAREEGEAGALAKLQQTTHARLAESGAIERARKEERDRLHALLGAVPGDDEAVTVALSWLSQVIDGKEEGDRAAFSERVNRTRARWIEQVAQHHVEALRDLCVRHGDSVSVADASAMGFGDCITHLLRSLESRAKQIEDLKVVALFPPQTYREDSAEAYARGLADGTTRALARIEEAAAEYVRRARAMRVEVETVEVKAAALADLAAAVHRELAP